MKFTGAGQCLRATSAGSCGDEVGFAGKEGRKETAGMGSPNTGTSKGTPAAPGQQESGNLSYVGEFQLPAWLVPQQG